MRYNDPRLGRFLNDARHGELPRTPMGYSDLSDERSLIVIVSTALECIKFTGDLVFNQRVGSIIMTFPLSLNSPSAIIGYL